VFVVEAQERTEIMPMSLKREVQLLSMVDILGPLSDEEMEGLAKRAPDTFLEKDDILYNPKEGMERLFILKEGRVQLYEVDQSGEEITLSVVEDGNVFGEMALTGQSLERVMNSIRNGLEMRETEIARGPS
jgi:CRP-like cAMP-binding protein